MQKSGGLLLPPVQKLVATLISAQWAEMQTNLDTRTGSASYCSDILTAEHLNVIDMR